MPTDQQDFAQSVIDNLMREYTRGIMNVMNVRGELAVTELIDITCLAEEQRHLVRCAIGQLVLDGKLELDGGTVIMPDASREDPRPYSNEESCKLLIQHFICMVDYWLGVDRPTERERMMGLVHSILCTFDGSNCAFPAFDISPSYCDGDVDYMRERGERWFPQTAINSCCSMHEMLHRIDEEMQAERTATEAEQSSDEDDDEAEFFAALRSIAEEPDQEAISERRDSSIDEEFFAGLNSIAAEQSNSTPAIQPMSAEDEARLRRGPSDLSGEEPRTRPSARMERFFRAGTEIMMHGPPRTRQEIRDEVMAFIENYPGIERGLSMDTQLTELGLDSLDAIEMVISAEEIFGIEVPDEHIAFFQVVGDIVDYIESVVRL